MVRCLIDYDLSRKVNTQQRNFIIVCLTDDKQIKDEKCQTIEFLVWNAMTRDNTDAICPFTDCMCGNQESDDY